MTPSLSRFFLIYIASWATFSVAAVILFARDKKGLIPEWRRYLGFLLVPWKLGFFAIAFAFVTFAGRYANDESWDWVTGSGMSILTFLTAP
jgi:hypothetical protein